MNDFESVFWGKQLEGRLWHAIQDGRSAGICGKAIPIPRMSQKEVVPPDDERCARCDRMIQPDEDRP